MVYQHSATLVVPVNAGKSDSLENALLAADIKQRSAPGLLSPEQLTQVHLLSASLVPSFGHTGAHVVQPGQSEYLMVLEINYDGTLESVCDELWVNAKEFLLLILGMCDCGNKAYQTGPRGLEQLLRQGVKEKIFYSGVRGISVPEIRSKSELRDKAIEYVGGIDSSSLTSRELSQTIEDHLKANNSLGVIENARPLKVRIGPERIGFVSQLLFFLLVGVVFLGSGAWGGNSVSAEVPIRARFPGFLLFLVSVIALYMVARTNIISRLFSKSVYSAVSGGSRMLTRESAVTASRQNLRFNQFVVGLVALAVLLLLFYLGFSRYAEADCADLVDPCARWVSGNSLVNLLQHITSFLFGAIWLFIFVVVIKKTRTWDYIENYIHRFVFVYATGVLLLFLFSGDWIIHAPDKNSGMLRLFLQDAASNLLVLVGIAFTSALVFFGIKAKLTSLWIAVSFAVIALYGVIQAPLEKAAVAKSLFLLVLIAGYVITLIFCKLRAQERVALEDAPYWPDNEKRKTILLKESENQNRANQLISITQVKPHWLRRSALRAILWIINLRANWTFTRGKLSGIETIYFAQWYLIDGGQRLLFITNYYGDWDRYLDEFIDTASTGITGIWGNTEGFPRSRWLFNDGSRHEEKFKAYARASQIPTQFFYCAYPELSVTRIQDNLYFSDLIRKKKRSDGECDALVSLL